MQCANFIVTSSGLGSRWVWSSHSPLFTIYEVKLRGEGERGDMQERGRGCGGFLDLYIFSFVLGWIIAN